MTGAIACAFCCVQSDYEAANFDVKKAKGYWQLGRLGLEETQELQAKVHNAGMKGMGADRWGPSTTSPEACATLDDSEVAMLGLALLVWGILLVKAAAAKPGGLDSRYTTFLLLLCAAA